MLESFWFCKSFASVSIPESVTEIGREAFGGCESLAEIRYGGTKAQWEMIEKGSACFHAVAADSVRCTDGMVEIGQYKEMSEEETNDYLENLLGKLSEGGTMHLLPRGTI